MCRFELMWTMEVISFANQIVLRHFVCLHQLSRLVQIDTSLIYLFSTHHWEIPIQKVAFTGAVGKTMIDLFQIALLLNLLPIVQYTHTKS